MYEAVLGEDGTGPYQRECGRITQSTLEGRIWTGHWIQEGNDREGDFSIELSTDAQSADGRWWYTRIGNNDSIPPGEYGGSYRWQRLLSPPAQSPAPAEQTYPEGKKDELSGLMDETARNLNFDPGNPGQPGGHDVVSPSSLGGVTSLAACPTGTRRPMPPPPQEGEPGYVWDPWEAFNRFFFAVNLHIDNYLMQPVIKHVINPLFPEPVRKAIVNMFQNLDGPESALSLALMGDFGGAAKAVARFLINTTLGLLGAFDVAKSQFSLEPIKANLEKVAETWGVPRGPYLVMPFARPSNLRDTIIWAAKQYLSPWAVFMSLPGRLILEASSRVAGRSLDPLGHHDPDELYDPVRRQSISGPDERSDDQSVVPLTVPEGPLP